MHGVYTAHESVNGRLPYAAAAAADAFITTTVGACSGDETTPNLPSARIDYMDGAIEPIIARGERFVIEGLGFGTTPGKVRFPRLGGGTVDVIIADSDWTLF